jgi:hypothetical protein
MGFFTAIKGAGRLNLCRVFWFLGKFWLGLRFLGRSASEKR